MPKKIDKKAAYQLNGLIPRIKELERAAKKAGKVNNELIIDKYALDLNDYYNKEVRTKENVDTTNQAKPYVPGDLTDEKHKLQSHEKLAAHRYGPEVEKSQGFPKIREDFSRHSPPPPQDIDRQVEEICRLNQQMIEADYKGKHLTGNNKEKRLFAPILSAISNFRLAKKLHRENLEHNPLPDSVTDHMYRKIQMQRKQQEPGLALEDQHVVTGVGWKGYPGYGPTRCTKLKVYRPKTCGPFKDLRDTDSISSFDQKWRFIRQSKVTPMDLAICWDLTPDNPRDEPERTTHIDGSNGSAAPAVFSLVHTPKSEGNIPACDGIRGCGQVFDHIDKGNEAKEYFFHRSKNRPPSVKSDEEKRSTGSKDSIKSRESVSKLRAKSALDLNAIDKQSVKSKDSNSSKNSRAKSANNLDEIDRHFPSYSKEYNNNDKLMKSFHQSTPDLTQHEKFCKKGGKLPNKKLCMACEMKNMSLREPPKPEYKMAFKAGIPQKPKVKRYDYPEHWRLATVYQHSYKPIFARKRPLLQTVFK